MEEEEMEDSAYDPDTDTATWEGEINGKVYIGIYDGKTGEGSAQAK